MFECLFELMFAFAFCVFVCCVFVCVFDYSCAWCIVGSFLRLVVCVHVCCIRVFACLCERLCVLFVRMRFVVSVCGGLLVCLLVCLVEFVFDSFFGCLTVRS